MSEPSVLGDPPVADVLIRAEEIEPQAIRQIEGRLRDLILSGIRVIVVELPDGASLDASLAGMLLRVQRSVSWRNGRLIVVAPEEARKTLDFMGLTESLELVDTRRR
jgi:anti-anti-sigma regulatory factor